MTNVERMENIIGCAKFAFVGDGYVPSIAESVAKFHDAASKIVQDVVTRMLDEVNE